MESSKAKEIAMHTEALETRQKLAERCRRLAANVLPKDQ